MLYLIYRKNKNPVGKRVGRYLTQFYPCGLVEAEVAVEPKDGVKVPP
jgi:hypothetical protein